MTRLSTALGGRTFKVRLDARGDGVPTTVDVDGQTFEMLWSPRHGVLSVHGKDGVERHLPVRMNQVTRYPGEAEVHVQAEVWMGGRSGSIAASATISPEVVGGGENLGNGGDGATGRSHADKAVRSPITGKVLKVMVKLGDTVQAGEPLVIVEAMKMENRVFAPHAGVVKTLNIKDGDAVTTGKELLRLGGLPS